jgi:hypothetical protein
MQKQIASPATGTAPNIDALVAEIDDRGFAVIPGLITLEEADAARVALDELRLAENPGAEAACGSQRVGRIAVKHQIFRDLMVHPTIVALWRAWLGNDMVCSTWSGNTLFPGNTTLEWHADYPYWAMQEPWPAGKLTGQTIWMLDDFYADNGATGVVPYSHHRLAAPQNIRAERSDAEILTGVRGSVAVLHGALWHSARANCSTQPRSALLGMYIRPALTPMENMRGQLSDIEAPGELLAQVMGANAFVPKDVGS